MRFIWLSLSIVLPLVAVNFIGKENDVTIAGTYLVVASLTEIVLLALTISEFVKNQKSNEYKFHKKLKSDRDADISKLRKEFMQDALNLYEVQKESLKRAKDIYNSKNENKTDKQNNEINA